VAVNRDKPDLWKEDIAASVDKFNRWFMRFAPKAFRATRRHTTKEVERALRATENLSDVSPKVLKQHPEILPTLRMSTCPPLAIDRLIGLAGVPASLVRRIESEKKLPVRLSGSQLDSIGICYFGQYSEAGQLKVPGEAGISSPRTQEDREDYSTNGGP